MKRVDDFRQRSPGDGVPASRKTEAWIGYDDQNFYVVFACQLPAGETRARLAKREDIFSDDVVGLIVDTYHDHQRGYEFFVSDGIQADAIESEGQNDDFSFDTLWYSEGRLTPEGFVAMITVPFRSLRFARGGPQTWGIALMRIVPTTNENDFWPYVTQKVDGFNQQMGTMRGLESISPGRNLQFIPYAAFSGSHFLDDPTYAVPAFRSKTDLAAGAEGGVDHGLARTRVEGGDDLVGEDGDVIGLVGKTLGNIFRAPFDLVLLLTPFRAVPDLDVVVDTGHGHLAAEPRVLDQRRRQDEPSLPVELTLCSTGEEMPLQAA